MNLDATAAPARTTLPGVLGVARAPFLPLALLLALSGSLAQGLGALDLVRLAVAVVGLVAAHCLVNVLNELADDASGLDHMTERTPFSGGSGALQSGLITRQGAWWVAIVSGAVALAAMLISLAVFEQWRLVPVVAGGALCILLYTPWLLRIGLGEAAAGLGLGGLPVIGAALLQGGELKPAVLFVAVASAAMVFNLLLYNTIPDAEADRRAGRRSLVHRFGVPATARIGIGAWAVATGSLGLGIVAGALSPWALLAAIPAGVFLKQVAGWTAAGTPLPVPHRVLASNVIHNLGTQAALVAAWLISHGLGH
jgi:1,4-dihydroxy-2-naphthoate octaprenyltransferase